MKKIISSSLFFILLFFSLESSGQVKVYKIKAFDKLTDEGIWNVEIYMDDRMVAKSNSRGFFEVNTLLGNVLVLSHDKYETVQIMLPEENNLSVPLEIKTKEIDYKDGLESFYQHVVQSINENLKSISKDKSKVVFVEFMVNENGDCFLTKLYNDNSESFNNIIKETLKSISGKWNAKYNGKRFLLPIQLDFDAPDSTVYSKLSITKTDKVLESIIVAANGAFYNDNIFVNRKED